MKAIFSRCCSKSLIGALTLCLSPLSLASEWSVNEVHLQRGQIEALSFLGGAKANTTIITFQHASGWEYGSNFFFIDRIDDDVDDGFNDKDWYGEWYTTLSLSKMRGEKTGFGAVKDIGLIMGFNWAADADVTKYLPGVRLSWDVPGFAFLNTDITAYIDDSDGVAEGGVPAQDDSFMIDVNWAYPFEVGEQSFSIVGHMEYIDSRKDEFGNDVESWVLAQPQFRWDLGRQVMNEKDKMFLGIEFQYWRNKLGDANTDETTAQFLFVMRF